MIGVSAPWILIASAIGAIATVVLHFLSVRRPPVLVLPTMRFLPERPVRAVSRSARPSDLWLLLLRVAALLLAGVALSGMTWRGTGVKHGRILVVQRGFEQRIEDVRTQVASALQGAYSADTTTRIVIVDSAAHVLNAAESKAFRADTLSAIPARALRQLPTLSTDILVATRAAGELVREERTVDAIDLVIAASLVRHSSDASLRAVRESWPGAIRFVDTQHNPDVVDSVVVIPYKRTVALVGAASSDAVQSAFTVRGWLGAAAGTVAAPNVAADAHPPIAVEWPASGAPEGWTTSAPATVGAVIARGEALVFPFVRTAHVPESILAQGRAIAWWNDGEVAAVEIPTATACTRHVGVSVPPSSDLLQGQAARALLFALSGPCGGEGSYDQLSAAELRVLSGSGGAAPASAFKSSAAVRTPFAPFLLLLALALLLAEWMVRDREERLSDGVGDADASLRKVA